MIATIELKKRIAGHQGGCIDGYLHRLSIDEGSEVGFHRTVLHLRLAVGLWVESVGKPAFDMKEVTKQWNIQNYFR